MNPMTSSQNGTLQQSSIWTFPRHDLHLTILDPSSDRFDCTTGALEGIDVPASTDIRRHIMVMCHALSDLTLVSMKTYLSCNVMPFAGFVCLRSNKSLYRIVKTWMKTQCETMIPSNTPCDNFLMLANAMAAE